MTVKITRADGEFEFYDIEKYRVSTIKDLHPIINKVEIFSGRRKIFTLKRRFSWWYKKITFKSAVVQSRLAEIAKQKATEE